jgi:uncharacterized protein (DUF1697 family)
VHVTTLTAEELDAVVAEMPFRMTGRDPSRLMVGFFRTPTDERRVDGVLGERAFSRELARGPRVVYIWCPDGLLESRAAQAIAKAAGAGITTRNWSTVVKLARLAQPDAAPR